MLPPPPFLTLTLTLTLTLILTLPLPPAHAQCMDLLDTLHVTDKVINGNPSNAAYAISLSSPPMPSVRRCTGTRISPDWALTAAHCAVNTSWSLSVSGSTIHDGHPATILDVHPHPRYVAPTDRRYDIALLRIRAPEPAPDAVVLLNDHPALPEEDAFVRVAGYGAVDSSEQPVSGNLTHVDIPFVPMQECKRLYAGTPNLGRLDPRKQMCAGYPTGACDACSGDSGGPVIQFDRNGNPVQVGIISASRGCALPGFPGISVRVDAFRAWMKEMGATFSTGRGLQVTRARGGRIVIKDPPKELVGTDGGADEDKDQQDESQDDENHDESGSSDDTGDDTGDDTSDDTSDDTGAQAATPTPSPTPAVVRTPQPERPASQPRPSKRPSEKRPKKPADVGQPLGPRPRPPNTPTPDDEELLEGIEDEQEDDKEASASPEAQTSGSLAGDVSVGADVVGRVNGGVVAGGVVGGLVLLVALVGGVFFVWKKRDDASVPSREGESVPTGDGQSLA